MHTDARIQALTDSYQTWMQGERQAGEGTPGAARMTRELYPFDAMFSPITINRTTVKNRLVMAPMGNIDMCEETGRPNDKMLQYFFARAKGGVGLITTGLVPVSHGIDNSITELGHLSYFPRIDRSRTVFSGWRDLAQGVHAFGTKIFIQLTPGLGRVGNPQCLITQHKLPVSASFNPNFYMPEVPCWRLSDRKLRKIIKNVGQATADAKAAGLDGAYLHGHEGYLLEQMTNPAFNRRKLGRYADYTRFGVDMVKEMRRRVGAAYPIMYRIDLSLALNETYGEGMTRAASLKKFTNGRTVEMTLQYMEELVRAGVDVFDVDLGCYDNWWLPHPPASMPAGCFLEVARMVKERFEKDGVKSNAGMPVPVVGVGKLGYPDLAERALRQGDCDMVMLGRPLLADPEWPNKAYAGRVEDITPCIGCQEGCLNEFVDGGHPQCAVNPRTSFEHLLPEVPPKAEKPLRVGVVGAGPAGVLCAVTAAKRGHRVELLEKSGEIGGKLLAGGTPQIKFDVDNYRRYLAHLVAETGELTFLPNTEANEALLKEKAYDALVFCVGTKAAVLPVPGIDGVKTIQAHELLRAPDAAGAAEHIVVVGGGAVGCETAQWLRYELGKHCTVVEMDSYFMHGACTANRGHLIHSLKKGGVALLNCAKVTGFAPGEVHITRNVSKNVPDPYNTWQPILPENIENPLGKKLGPQEEEQTLKADLVVLAAGGRPDDALFLAAQKARLAPLIYDIGDSFAPGRVLEATRAAYQVACKL